jgi:hypothetical protein
VQIAQVYAYRASGTRLSIGWIEPCCSVILEYSTSRRTRCLQGCVEMGASKQMNLPEWPPLRATAREGPYRPKRSPV